MVDSISHLLEGLFHRDALLKSEKVVHQVFEVGGQAHPHLPLQTLFVLENL